MSFFPWQQLKSKRICYFAIPLIIMATVVEFVILATGWKYQQVACLPKGMGVTFFSIGPIGATILAVELLKLPLAIWTASRRGWQKGFMLLFGLPLLCLLTFQLVKDMAVYEMGVAMTPASQLLEKATAEEVKIGQLRGELAAIEVKKADRQSKLNELTAKKAKAKSDLEESLKHNGDLRQDAISLTEYQAKELSEVEARQASIIKQFDADTAQITKAIAELRTQREAELVRATKWNAEEARIENEYKTKMAAYTNKKAAYEKARAEYDDANILRRQLMKEPVPPGVPPEREVNTVLKPTLVAEIEAQIKSKETELATVNGKRRERLAQVDADARRLREQFDTRSTTKREETDRKREELLAAQAALAAVWTAEEKQINQEFQAAAQKIDGIRGEIDACRKKAEGYYEEREASIKNQQVHRIATTVEIVRGWVRGERPVSIKSTPKERGDLYTDQISMVRIWVYPVLAFLVAFMPTLMVEIGFSTIFMPEQKRPPHRLGFLGRRLHWLYTRAGRIKILRAERLAKQAAAEVAARDKALTSTKATAEQALAGKEAELQTAREAMNAAAAEHEAQLKRMEAEQAEQARQKETEWVAKLAGLADSLNRTVAEKDALRDLQKSEVDRQVQMRQKAWSDRLDHLRQQLDEQRAASEAERTAMIQEHHQKLLELSEDSKAQVMQARRQAVDAERVAAETTAKLSRDLEAALNARQAAESQSRKLADAYTFELAQTKEEANRKAEVTARQEKLRLEQQQSEFARILQQQKEDSEHRLSQREQQLQAQFNARQAELQAQWDEDLHHRELDWKQEAEAATRVNESLRQELEAQDAVAEAERAAQMQEHQQKLAEITESSRLQVIQAHRQAADAALAAAETTTKLTRDLETALAAREAAECQLRQQAESFASQQSQAREDASREAEKAARQEKLRLEQQQSEFAKTLRQKETDFEHRLTQREEELSASFEARLAETQARMEQEARRRETEIEAQAEARARELEARWKQELQQRDEAARMRLKQREQQLQAQAEARVSELQAEAQQGLSRREAELERQLDTQLREVETRAKQELQQRELTFQSKLKQREQELTARGAARELELQNQWRADLRLRQEEWERQTESLVRAAEGRLNHEAQQKDELFQSTLRQHAQQWQVKLDAQRAELQTQAEQELRRREAKSATEHQRALRELEAQLRTEMQQKEEASQAQARQRERDLAARAEAQQTAALEQQKELELMNNRIQPLLAQLSRAEQERDEAKAVASEGNRQVQDLETKLIEASVLLTGWKNGKNGGNFRIQPISPLAMAGRTGAQLEPE